MSVCWGFLLLGCWLGASPMLVLWVYVRRLDMDARADRVRGAAHDQDGG